MSCISTAHADWRAGLSASLTIGVSVLVNRLSRSLRETEEALDQSTQELIISRRLASIGTFAAGVAHQIKNPLGSILNAAEYALLSEKDEDARDIFRAAVVELPVVAD